MLDHLPGSLGAKHNYWGLLLDVGILHKRLLCLLSTDTVVFVMEQGHPLGQGQYASCSDQLGGRRLVGTAVQERICQVQPVHVESFHKERHLHFAEIYVIENSLPFQKVVQQLI